MRQKEPELDKLPTAERAAKEKELVEAESAHIRSQRSKISRKNFKSIKLIGRGAFGEVRNVIFRCILIVYF